VHYYNVQYYEFVQQYDNYTHYTAGFMLVLIAGVTLFD